MTPSLELFQYEMDRARVYRAMADAFSPPDSELVNAINRIRIFLEKWGSNAGDAAARLPESFGNPDTIDPLKVDYTRLFMGPFLLLAPPYGSVYLENNRRIMGDSTVDVRNHYLDAGFDLAENFKEAPDHVCAELEFMHALVCREIEAIHTDDRDKFTDSRMRQQEFLSNHLGAWVPDFTARIIEHAQTAFYRTLGEVTRRFIQDELQIKEEAYAIL